MKYIILMMISLSSVFATQTEVIHSSISLYGESKKFTNSVQKYDDFNVAQSDLKLDYKSKIGNVGYKVTSITKYIAIDEKNRNGFKIQHHAMEFDKTYAVGLGKDIYDYVVRVQYIYQEAQEIGIRGGPNGKDVEVQNLRLTANYKF